MSFLQIKYRVSYKIGKNYIDALPQYEIYDSHNLELQTLSEIWSSWVSNYWLKYNYNKKFRQYPCYEVFIFSFDIVSHVHKWTLITNHENRILKTLEVDKSNTINLRFVIREPLENFINKKLKCDGIVNQFI